MGSLMYRIDRLCPFVVQCPTDDWNPVIYRYDDLALARHRVQRSDANEVIDTENTSTRVFDLPLSESGDLQVMYVGFNDSGRLLEIAMRLIGETEFFIFHGQAVSPAYHKLYKERLDNEKTD